MHLAVSGHLSASADGERTFQLPFISIMYNSHARQWLEESCIQFCGRLLVGWNWGFMFWESFAIILLQTEN